MSNSALQPAPQSAWSSDTVFRTVGLSLLPSALPHRASRRVVALPDPGDRQPGSGQVGQAGQHLTAIAARLTTRGVASRLTRLGGTPILTIDRPAAGPDPITVTVDPDTSNSSGLPVECTCLWTPAPGTTPEATADTIVAVLNALRPDAERG